MNSVVKGTRVFVASVIKGLSVDVQTIIGPPNVVCIELNEQQGLSAKDKEDIVETAEVLLADSPVIQDVIHSAKKLKWAASTWAGVETLVKSLDPDKPPACQITRMGGAFGSLMADYVLAYILARERSVIELWQEQQNRHWNSTDFRDYRSISGLTIGILGVGDIGKQVAERCNCLGMNVIGVTRSIPTEDTRCPAVSEYRLRSDLAEVLKSCDYVCNILPSTPETRSLLSGDILANCKHKFSSCSSSSDLQGRLGCLTDKGWLLSLPVTVTKEMIGFVYDLSDTQDGLKCLRMGFIFCGKHLLLMIRNQKCVFINLGRGDIISEESLLTALREKWLDGAVLDVFSPEPLRSDSPLWTMPGVYITPHLSGVSLSKQVSEAFYRNYQLYCDNKPLKYVLDIKRGY